MIEPLSQTAKVFRDTTISRSTGSEFRRVCALYGLPFTDEVPEDDWREAVKVMAFGRRGVPGTTLAFVEAMTSSWGVDVAVDITSANPTRLTATVGTPWAAKHVGRWVRMADTSKIHMIVSVGGGGAHVELASIGTSQWSAANFTGTASTTATILPFTIAERGGGPGQGIGHYMTRKAGKLPQVEVTMYVVGLLPPPTYMQPGAAIPPAPASVPGDAAYNSGSMDPVPNASPLIGADARPGGQPYGGHVQLDEGESGDIGGAGPFPIYLSSGKVLHKSRAVLDACLASGIEVAFIDGHPT
jgi:hypothetical protein